MANYVAGQIVKLMASKKILAKGSRVLVLGLTFKENCPDLRNSKVADVVRELQNYGAKVDVYDPWIDRDEAEHEYGIRPIKRVRDGVYDAAVLAVGHKEFRDMGIDKRAQGLQEESRGVRHQVRVPRRPGRWPAVTDRSHEDPAHRRRRLHRLSHVAQQAAGARRRSRRPRQPQRLLRSEPQARAARHPRARAEVPLREDGSRRQGRHEVAVRAREVSARDPPGRAGRRALLAREPAGLHRQQRHRHAQRARGLPPQRRRAPGVRLDQLGVRPQHQHAVLACTAASIIRCRCTRRPSAPTSSWRTTTRRCSNYP